MLEQHTNWKRLRIIFSFPWHKNVLFCKNMRVESQQDAYFIVYQTTFMFNIIF